LPAQLARKGQKPKPHTNTEALGNNQKEIKPKKIKGSGYLKVKSRGQIKGSGYLKVKKVRFTYIDRLSFK